MIVPSKPAYISLFRGKILRIGTRIGDKGYIRVVSHHIKNMKERESRNSHN